MWPMNARDSVPLTATHPLTIVVTKTGLWLQWCGQQRVQLSEAEPLALTAARAQALILGLSHSLWVKPPTMKAIPWQTPTVYAVRKAWLTALRARFGRDVLNMVLRMFGRQAHINHVFAVRPYLRTFEQRCAERPALMSLLRYTPHVWNQLDSWRCVKLYCASLGMSAEVWRWLNRQSAGAVSRVDLHNPAHMAWLHAWCWMGRPIPSSLYDRATGAIDGFGGLSTWIRRCVEQSGPDIVARRSHWVHYLTGRGRAPAPMSRRWFQMARALRLAVDQWLSVSDSQQRLWLTHEEFPLVADWLIGVSAAQLHIAKHWQWQHVIKAQSVWHLEMDPAGLSELAFFGWSTAIDQIQLPCDILAQALTSTRALVEESRRMHHCVPGYLERCLSGQVRLFHLRSTAGQAERATLEIRWQPHLKRWVSVQLKGPCNARVSPRMEQAAHELAVRYSMQSKHPSPG